MTDKNEVAVSKTGVPSLTMDENELIEVLTNSVYPGAALASIKLVINYCKARQLDPLQKPVHIVPMDVCVGKGRDGKKIYEKRDVIMPGVGLYRTDAARTGEYAGKTEPQFGEPQALKLKYQEEENGPVQEREFFFPEWCKVTVKRLIKGVICEYTAVEYWLENYATTGRNSKTPNAMWSKRPRGQIAKCTEAQALRMAFPEAVGAAPTADEMEGKTIDVDEAERINEKLLAHKEGGEGGEKKEVPTYSQDLFDKNLSQWTKLIQNKKRTASEIITTIETKATKLTDAQKKTLTDIRVEEKQKEHAE